MLRIVTPFLLSLSVVIATEVVTITNYDAEIFSGEEAVVTVSYSFTAASMMKCVLKGGSGGTGSSVTTTGTLDGEGVETVSVTVVELEGVECDYYWRCYSYYVESASNAWSERTTLVELEGGSLAQAADE